MLWVVNVKPQPLYPRKWPCSHCLRGWVGPRAGLEACGNPVPIGIRTPYRLAPSEYYPAHNRSASGIFQVFRQIERLTLLRVTVRLSHRGQSSGLCDKKRPDNGNWRQQWLLYCINIQCCISETQQNIIMFIIVLGRHVSILYTSNPSTHPPIHHTCYMVESKDIQYGTVRGTVMIVTSP